MRRETPGNIPILWKSWSVVFSPAGAPALQKAELHCGANVKKGRAPLWRRLYKRPSSIVGPAPCRPEVAKVRQNFVSDRRILQRAHVRSEKRDQNPSNLPTLNLLYPNVLRLTSYVLRLTSYV